MKFNILFIVRFMKYLQAMILYKQRIAYLLNIKLNEINKIYNEINNSEFMKELIKNSNIRRGFFDFSMLSVLRAPTLYVLCRIIQPEIVVETGVAEGFSSAFILYALEKNHKGHLYSIDLPNQPGQELKGNKYTGWLIPENLKSRWTLILGPSREKLPPLLANLKKVNIFYHDSDHSYDNMLFEFKEAEKYLNLKGILIADDITENNAFEEFCKKSEFNSVRLFKTGIAK